MLKKKNRYMYYSHKILCPQKTTGHNIKSAASFSNSVWCYSDVAFIWQVQVSPQPDESLWGLMQLSTYGLLYQKCLQSSGAYWYILADHKTAVVNQFDLHLRKLAKNNVRQNFFWRMLAFCFVTCILFLAVVVCFLLFLLLFSCFLRDGAVSGKKLYCVKNPPIKIQKFVFLTVEKQSSNKNKSC